MQCDETIGHMVTAGWSYFRTLQNACATAGKTIMTAGKIYHGCFEMLSWPHRTSANIISICFWLLETCTKCSYFIEESIRPGAQQFPFEVKCEYVVCRPRIYRGPAACTWASFQTTGAWCVKGVHGTKKVDNHWFSEFKSIFNKNVCQKIQSGKLFSFSITNQKNCFSRLLRYLVFWFPEKLHLARWFILHASWNIVFVG